MAETRDITIVIVEDHEITRVGLRLSLECNAGLKVVGEAEDGQQALRLVEELRPDVVLMDIGLPFVDGIKATQTIKARFPDIRVIMLTCHDTDQDIFGALSSGADGYCMKETPSGQLVVAIETVADGAAWLCPGVASRVLRTLATAARGSASGHLGLVAHGSSLSIREIDVLRLVVEGMSNQEIARHLCLSVETVKTHMKHLMEKLAVNDRTQAAVKAMREGLV